MDANKAPFGGVAATFRYERDELARWLHKGGTRARKRYTVYILLLAVLAINFAVVIPTAASKTGPVLMTLICVAALLFVLYTVKRGGSTTQLDALYAQGKEYHVFFKQDGFKIGVQGGEAFIGYEEKVRVQETDTCYFIRYRERELFIVPKSALGDVQVQKLSGFLSQRLGKEQYRS